MSSRAVGRPRAPQTDACGTNRVIAPLSRPGARGARAAWRSRGPPLQTVLSHTTRVFPRSISEKIGAKRGCDAFPGARASRPLFDEKRAGRPRSRRDARGFGRVTSGAFSLVNAPRRGRGNAISTSIRRIVRPASRGACRPILASWTEGPRCSRTLSLPQILFAILRIPH